jgi:hypothetical protein
MELLQLVLVEMVVQEQHLIFNGTPGPSPARYFAGGGGGGSGGTSGTGGTGGGGRWMI